MKEKEYKMLLKGELDTSLPPKVLQYILKKWKKKGWYDNGFTNEFYRIRDLALNKNDYIHDWDGRIVNISWSFRLHSLPTVQTIITSCYLNQPVE